MLKLSFEIELLLHKDLIFPEKYKFRLYSYTFNVLYADNIGVLRGGAKGALPPPPLKLVKV